MNFRCAAFLAGGLLAGCAATPPDLGATREQVVAAAKGACVGGFLYV